VEWGNTPPPPSPSGPGPPHCRGFTVVHRHTALCRTPLDERPAHRRNLYLTTPQHSHETDVHAPGGVRIRNPSKRAAADPHLRPRCHCDGLLLNSKVHYRVHKNTSLVCLLMYPVHTLVSRFSQVVSFFLVFGLEFFYSMFPFFRMRATHFDQQKF
jgi:hypothetical protein